MVRHLGALAGLRGYKYGLYRNPQDEDPFLGPALELFDRDIYEECQNWTKKGATVAEAQRILLDMKNQKRAPRPEWAPDERLDWERAKRKTLWAFSVDGLKVSPYSLEEALEGMEMHTAAGYTFPGKKKSEVKDELFASAQRRVLDAKIGRRVEATPCTVGSRGHLRLKTNPKRRVVMVVPGEHVCVERMFSVPITEKLKANPDKSPMFFGADFMIRLRRLLEIEHGYGSVSVHVDVETFDRDVPEWLMEEAFDVVEDLLDFETFHGERVPPAAQKRWKRVFAMVREYFIHTPVMLFDGSLIWMDGSVPSGSAFTQLIDSIISYLMMQFLSLRTGHGIYDLKVLGDDCKLDLAGRPKLDLWAHLMLRWFGMKLSLKKTRIYGAGFRQRKFLGYNLMSGFLERDRLELFNLAIHPEKKVDSLIKSYTRLTAYMFLGGVNDKRFCQFFEFVQSCYDIPDVAPELDYELDTKRKYAGFDMPWKTLRSYTLRDFRHGLFRYLNW